MIKHFKPPLLLGSLDNVTIVLQKLLQVIPPEKSTGQLTRTETSRLHSGKSSVIHPTSADVTSEELNYQTFNEPTDTCSHQIM